MCGILNEGDKCHASAHEVRGCIELLAVAEGEFTTMQETSPSEFGDGIKRCIESDGKITSNRCKLLEDRESNGLLGITLVLSMEALDAMNDLAHQLRLASCER